MYALFGVGYARFCAVFVRFLERSLATDFVEGQEKLQGLKPD